jgi:hypothetical protein
VAVPATADRAGNVEAVRTVIAILCTAALLAGCGDDDEETTPAVDTTPPAEVETEPAPAPPPPTEPEVTTPVEPPADGDDSGGAQAPRGDGGAGDGAIAAPGGCGRAAFEHGSDSGAFGIEAAGVDCDVARAVAREAAGHGDDRSYQARGFDCSGAIRDEPPMPVIEWVCLRGDEALVRFTAS